MLPVHTPACTHTGVREKNTPPKKKIDVWENEPSELKHQSGRPVSAGGLQGKRLAQKDLCFHRQRYVPAGQASQLQRHSIANVEGPCASVTCLMSASRTDRPMSRSTYMDTGDTQTQTRTSVRTYVHKYPQPPILDTLYGQRQHRQHVFAISCVCAWHVVVNVTWLVVYHALSAKVFTQ